MSEKLIFLGTGTSHGIPVPGCNCGVCRSENTRNRRTRCSVVFQTDGRNILVDTATELRLQCLANNISRIDAVLMTHDHADHIHGIDDLRSFSSHARIPVYGQPELIDRIRDRFHYIFTEHIEGGGIPDLELIGIENEFNIKTTTILPVPLFHGSMRIFGYRIGNIAYCTDCSRIPDESYPLLENLDVLVIDGLRFEKHSTHFSVDEALAEIKKINPRQAYLTHMCHHLDHDELEKHTPGNVHVAYDGLTVTDKSS